VLLDTCVVIDILRGKPDAVGFLGDLTARPSVSAVSIAEVFAGLRSQREELAARSFFRDCHQLSLSPVIAETGGMMLRHYKASHGTDVPDALIAATAEHHGLTLATLNVKHFPMFKKLKPAY
jgi:predicted nucleic acid-binding protein